MTVSVKVVESDLSKVRPKLDWEPVQGQETLDFVKRKNERNGIPTTALNTVVFEAQQILGRCISPGEDAQDTTGLVVGYVQSGKTLSFTTLSALAHDNGFGLVVLIAGTIEALLLQTLKRLNDDLDLENGGVGRPWMIVDRPSPNTPSAATLQQHLKLWTQPDVPKHRKRVCLVVVLKQHIRLANLRECLTGIDLTKVPTLIIDDEADQASLNTFAAKNTTTGSNRKSTNYTEILELKSIFPHHTYVQYTATPQANLLISLDDVLSPKFGELLTPGAGYTGGEIMFKPNSGFAKTIPDAEADATHATVDAPPATLMDALRVYLLGACAAEHAAEKVNRTMMIHPSQQTGLHNDYLRWMGDAVEQWRSATAIPELFTELKQDFEKAYDDLKGTVGELLASFEDLMLHLPFVLKIVSVREVNSKRGGGSPIIWSQCEYWILVGGAKLDRGFTVEGLTVTYMPRPLATGNADSLQQRARFYGYKSKYIGYCRVYLRSDVRVAFERYVEHEQDIHRSLEKTRGQSLKNWVRQFTLDESMQPTRKGVIGIPVKEVLADGWKSPRAAHKAPLELNQTVFENFIDLVGKESPGEQAQLVDAKRYIDKRGSSKRNILHQEVPLVLLIDEFFKKLNMVDDDDRFLVAGQILILRKLVEAQQEFADVFVMGEFEPQGRSLSSNGTINAVFSGRSPARTTDRSKLNYGGDADFFAPHRITLQVRRFNILAEDGNAVSISNVPWYSFHVPDALKKRFLIEKETQ